LLRESCLVIFFWEWMKDKHRPFIDNSEQPFLFLLCLFRAKGVTTPSPSSLHLTLSGLNLDREQHRLLAEEPTRYQRHDDNIRLKTSHRMPDADRMAGLLSLIGDAKEVVDATVHPQDALGHPQDALRISRMHPGSSRSPQNAPGRPHDVFVPVYHA